jgi:ankyrin repeat protein
MKTKLIALLMLVGGGACAEPSEQALKLAYQMQSAILETQDVTKVEALLKQGVDVNAPIGCGTYSPLDGAIDKQNVGLLKFLLARGGKPLAHHLARAAFSSGSQQALEMTQALVEAGLDPNARDPDASNALISATYRENQALVRFLLAQRGIKLNEFDVDGFTALMWAIKHGSSEIVDLLLQAGASVDAANKRGETAIAVAEQEIQQQQAILAKLKIHPRKG